MKSTSFFAKNRSAAVLVCLATVSIAVGVIGINGAAGEHTGWIVCSHEPAGDGQLFAYQSRVDSGNPVYRGNDMFRVTSPRIIDSENLVLSQDWDRSTHKGTIHFSTSRKLNADERLPVVYSLDIRWNKILPALMTLLALFGAAVVGRTLYRNPDLFGDERFARLARYAWLLALAGFSWWLFACPGWSYGDDFFILNSTVQGDLLPAMVFPETGRFFPLGLIDLNLLIPFGDNPLAYHLERFALLLMLCGIMYGITTRTAGVAAGCLLMLVFLTTPDLFRIYSDSIFPESLLAVLLALFFWSSFAGSRSGNAVHLWISCGAAALATYCKEPVFGLFLVYALVQLLFARRQMSRGQVWANLFLIVNALVFLAAYFWICSGGASYAEIHNEGMGRTRLGVLASFLKHPWFLLAVAWGVWRSWKLLVRNDRRVVKYDAALYSGIAYVGAYAILKLSADYYLIPAYVCWTAAFGGYLRHTRLAAIKVPSLQRRTAYAAVAGMLLVIGSLQLPGTTSGIQEAIQARADTRDLAHLFSQLESGGFALYVYIPEEMTGFPAHVQTWRRRVINTFDSNARGDLNRQDSGKGPFQILGDGELPVSGQKVIVIHDPDYPNAMLNQSRGPGQQFQLVDFAPHVMGGALYAPADCLEPLREIAASHPSSQLGRSGQTAGQSGTNEPDRVSGRQPGQWR